MYQICNKQMGISLCFTWVKFGGVNNLWFVLGHPPGSLDNWNVYFTLIRRFIRVKCSSRTGIKFSRTVNFNFFYL